MAENNNSMEMDNTETESMLLERHASSTPKIVENKISLENLFTLNYLLLHQRIPNTLPVSYTHLDVYKRQHYWCVILLVPTNSFTHM